MSLQTTLTGSGHGREVDVHVASTPVTDYNGLVVYTEELMTRRFFDAPLAGDSGLSLNINPATAGSSTLIHNGTDTAAWTASASTGSWTFDSTSQAYDGTQSIDATSANDNDTAVFTAPSAVNTSGINEVTLWVYVSKWTTKGTKNVNLSFSSGGLTVGQSVGLDAYIDITNTGVWQRAIIPASAFNLAAPTIDAFEVQLEAAGGPAPDVYLDLIEFGTSSSSQLFKAGPEKESIWEVHHVRLTVVCTGTSPNYNEFAGLSALTNGLLFQAFRLEAPTSVVLSSNADLFGIPAGNVEVIQGTANTTLIVDIPFTDRTFFLHGNEDDYIGMNVRDDLSTLPYFRITARVSELTLT